MNIKKGMRHGTGCVLSPLLFNIRATFCEALDKSSDRIKVNGAQINNIRYADDMVVITSGPIELQRMMDRVTQRSETF